MAGYKRGKSVQPSFGNRDLDQVTATWRARQTTDGLASPPEFLVQKVLVEPKNVHF